MSGVFGVVTPHPPIMVEAVGGARTSATRDSVQALRRAAAALAVFDPDVVVVMSPHAPAVFDAFAVDTSATLTGTFGQFGAPSARYSYRGDPEFARRLVATLARRGLAAVERAEDARLRPGELDHAVLVPMSFLDPSGSWPLVVLSYAGVECETHRAVGVAVREAADELARRVAFVASGDLSHRLTPDAPAGYSPLGSRLDETIVETVRSGKFAELPDIPDELVEAGGECGLRSFTALGGFAGADPVPTRVLAYEGPWGVGYLTALVGDAALDADARSTPSTGAKSGSAGSEESEIVQLARQVITAYVERGEVLEPSGLEDPGYPERAGAFVTLHREGKLRGCIGTILPTRPTLAEEVAHNAIEAASRDPRFPPLGSAELLDLDVKVDVLHPPETCSLDDLDPADYGLIVTSGWRRGLLLPDLEGVDSVEEQVEIAKRKGGILPHEPCSFERFRVDRYS